MKQQSFENKHSSLWQEIENTVSLARDKKLAFRKSRRKQFPQHFPNQYRQLCQQLATAKSRNYTSQLINRLNALVLSSHHLLYQDRNYSQHKILTFFFYTFPQSIRKNGKLLLIASILFYLPLFFFGVSCYMNEELIYSISDAHTVRYYESMYDPTNNNLGRERDSATDINMFGHYILNNIGIGFRTFALGILGGIGTVFILLFNGLHIGSVAGHLTQVGYTETFYGFVVGHAAFELTGIVLCGVAGLKVGLALLDPGSLSRIDSIKSASKEAITIVYGSAIMLLIAAFIEAFWSSSTALSNEIKYTFGAFMAMALTLYFTLVGRPHGSK